MDLGDDIIIEAIPASGYHFTGWSGEPTIDENDNPLEIVFVNSISITANFAPDLIEFSSQDGLLNLLIPNGTVALDAADEPLTNVGFTANENPQSPEEANIIGQAYNLEPEGATFEPPVTLTWKYLATDIPEGASEEALFIAYYDDDAGEWIALDSNVDLLENIIRVLIEHLTTFAILSPLDNPSQVEIDFTIDIFSISPDKASPGSDVTISALIMNEGQAERSQNVTLKINGVTEDTKNDLTLGPGAFTVVKFEVVKNESGTYLVDINGDAAEFTVTESVSTPPPSITPPTTNPTPTTTPPSTQSSGVNWPVVAPILSAVFLAIFLPIWLKRRRESLDW